MLLRRYLHCPALSLGAEAALVQWTGIEMAGIAVRLATEEFVARHLIRSERIFAGQEGVKLGRERADIRRGFIEGN